MKKTIITSLILCLLATPCLSFAVELTEATAPTDATTITSETADTDPNKKMEETADSQLLSDTNNETQAENLQTKKETDTSLSEEGTVKKVDLSAIQFVTCNLGEQTAAINFKESIEAHLEVKIKRIEFKDGISPVFTKPGKQVVTLLATDVEDKNYEILAGLLVWNNVFTLKLTNVTYNKETLKLSGTSSPNSWNLIQGQDVQDLVKSDKNGYFEYIEYFPAGSTIYVQTQQDGEMSERIAIKVPQDPIRTGNVKLTNGKQIPAPLQGTWTSTTTPSHTISFIGNVFSYPGLDSKTITSYTKENGRYTLYWNENAPYGSQYVVYTYNEKDDTIDDGCVIYRRVPTKESTETTSTKKTETTKKLPQTGEKQLHLLSLSGLLLIALSGITYYMKKYKKIS